MTGKRFPTFDSAYPVPFHLERDAGPRRYLLTNRGREPVDGVTVSLLGPGVMPATAPSTLERGESLEVLIRHVLIHEVGHHFGLSDEDMHRIETGG